MTILKAWGSTTYDMAMQEGKASALEDSICSLGMKLCPSGSLQQ
jgi:hypothetical protein